MRVIPYMLMGFLISYLLGLAGIPIFSVKGILINLVASGILIWAQYVVEYEST